MEFRCPNCATPQGLFDTRPVGPLACATCAKFIYFPQGEFPPIVASTFPVQQGAAVPLTPFFQVEPVRTPAEMSDGAESTQVDIQRHMPMEPSTMATTMPSLQVETAQPEGEIDPASVSAALDDIQPMVEADAPVDVTAAGHNAVAVLAGAEPGEMDMVSLAGGSFGEAPPPPMPGTSADHPHDEHWSIAESGPPPLQAKSPPPVPSAAPTDTDEMALLGLPPLPELSQSELIPVVSPPSAAEQAAEEERKAARGGKRTMLIAAAVALLAGIAMMVIVGGEVLKRTDTKGNDVNKLPTGAPLAASQPASAPVEQAKNDNKLPAPPNAAKRAEAIDHYNKGNKLYLAKKYKDALTEYRKALDSDSTFAYAHRGLGVTYASQGNNDKAIESYKSYLQLAPDAKDAKQVKQIIANSEK